eukprot:gene6411-1142_t
MPTPAAHPRPMDAVWAWQDSDGSWKTFATADSHLLETTSQLTSQLTTKDLTFNRTHDTTYTFDFVKMKQFNHSSCTRRNLKRNQHTGFQSTQPSSSAPVVQALLHDVPFCLHLTAWSLSSVCILSVRLSKLFPVQKPTCPLMHPLKLGRAPTHLYCAGCCQPDPQHACFCLFYSSQDYKQWYGELVLCFVLGVSASAGLIALRCFNSPAGPMLRDLPPGTSLPTLVLADPSRCYPGQWDCKYSTPHRGSTLPGGTGKDMQLNPPPEVQHMPPLPSQPLVGPNFQEDGAHAAVDAGSEVAPVIAKGLEKLAELGSGDAALPGILSLCSGFATTLAKADPFGVAPAVCNVVAGILTLVKKHQINKKDLKMLLFNTKNILPLFAGHSSLSDPGVSVTLSQLKDVLLDLFQWASQVLGYEKATGFCDRLLLDGAFGAAAGSCAEGLDYMVVDVANMPRNDAVAQTIVRYSEGIKFAIHTCQLALGLQVSAGVQNLHHSSDEITRMLANLHEDVALVTSQAGIPEEFHGEFDMVKDYLSDNTRQVLAGQEELAHMISSGHDQSAPPFNRMMERMDFWQGMIMNMGQQAGPSQFDPHSPGWKNKATVGSWENSHRHSVASGIANPLAEARKLVQQQHSREDPLKAARRPVQQGRKTPPPRNRTPPPQSPPEDPLLEAR